MEHAYGTPKTFKYIIDNVALSIPISIRDWQLGFVYFYLPPSSLKVPLFDVKLNGLCLVHERHLYLSLNSMALIQPIEGAFVQC